MPVMVTALSSRGQIVLPKKLRTALKLAVGTQFAVFSDNENILLKPIKEPQKGCFDNVLKQAQEWASEVGMRESDISEAIHSVRARKK